MLDVDECDRGLHAGLHAQMRPLFERQFWLWPGNDVPQERPLLGLYWRLQSGDDAFAPLANGEKDV